MEFSPERPAQEPLGLQLRKQDFCRGEEPRRSRTTPDREDRLRTSLQPDKIS